MEIKSQKGSLKQEELTSIARMEILRRHRFLFYISVIIFISILVGSFYFYVFNNTSWFVISWGPFAVVIALWWAYIFVYWPKSNIFYKLNKSALVPAIYSFSEQEFTVASDDGNYIKIPLNNFYELVNINNFIVLWENPTSVQIVPLRLFSNTDREKICEYVEQAKSNA